jgi:bacterioferritin-associated ferredoxin
VYACICHGVTEAEVVAEVQAGARDEEAVGDRCGAGTGCGSCLDRICALISTVDPTHGRFPLRVAG